MPPSLARWPPAAPLTHLPRRLLHSLHPPCSSHSRLSLFLLLCSLPRRSLSSSAPPVHPPPTGHSPIGSGRPPPRLQGAALQEALQSVTRWTKATGKDAIHRSFAFEDFNAAFAFMTRSALVAEQVHTVTRTHTHSCTHAHPPTTYTHPPHTFHRPPSTCPTPPPPPAELAPLCPQLNHHPAWSNVYNRVDVELETHDCNGISRNVPPAAHTITHAFSQPPSHPPQQPP